MTKRHIQHFCNEIFHQVGTWLIVYQISSFCWQLLGEVSGEGTKATEGVIRVDSSIAGGEGAHLLICKHTVGTDKLAQHTFPYVLSIVARDLLLKRYIHTTPILPSVVALFHHTESLESLMCHLEILALHTGIQMHWKPSFITISAQLVTILHSVCHVESGNPENTKRGPLVVHLEGSNIYCVTTFPVHTIPLYTPEELEQFIFQYFTLQPY